MESESNPKLSLYTAAIMALVGLTLAALTIEIFFRILGPGGVQSNPYIKDRPQFFFRPATSPNMAGNLLEVPKPKTTYRISVVGDSFTFAPGMQFDDTFSQHLGRLLNLGSRKPEKVEVVNLGQPGFSTFHEVQSVKKALDIGSDLILIEITLNDAQTRSLKNEPKEISSQFGPYHPTGTIATITKYWKTLGYILARIHNHRSVGAYIKYHRDLYEDPTKWNLFSQSLQSMIKLADEQHVKIGFVLFPLYDFEIDRNYPFSNIHKKIADEIRRANRPLLDLTARFEGIPVTRLQLIPRVDHHPNEIAHRIAAEAIYEWGKQNMLFPESALIKRIYQHRNNLQENRSLPR